MRLGPDGGFSRGGADSVESFKHGRMADAGDRYVSSHADGKMDEVVSEVNTVMESCHGE